MSFIVFALVAFALLESFNRIGSAFGMRPGIERLLCSVTLFWAWVVLVSYTLSIGHLLTSTSFGLVSFITIGVVFVFVPAAPEFLFEQVRDLFRSAFTASRQSWQIAVLLLCVLLWVGNALFRGLLFPPANWDSLTYHLPMIASWLQRGYVGYYETTTIRQVISPVNAEILQMFHIIFLGNDDIIQFVQTEWFVISLLGVYYLSRNVGLSVVWSISAAMLSLTVPLFLLESYSTQNDLSVVSGIILALVWLALYIHHRQRSRLVLLGITLGLLLGTKFHMLIAVPMFLIPATVALFQTSDGNRWKHVLIFFATLVISVLLLGSETYISNIVHYGQLIPRLGPLDTRPAGFSILFQNLLFFGKWWYVTCLDFVSPTTWDHNISHFGPLFSYVVLPLAVAGTIAVLIFLMRKIGSQKNNVILLSMIIVVAGTFFGFIYVHRQRPFDLRYVLFVPVLLTVVSVWLLNEVSKKLERIFAGLVALCVIVTTSLTAVMDSSPRIEDMMSLNPADRVTSNLPSINPEMELFGIIDDNVRSGESIIFSGIEDDWSYTLFGHDLSRHVYYATSVESFINYLNVYPIHWAVIRTVHSNQPIIDYIDKLPYKFQLIKKATDTTGNYFYTDLLLYKVRPEQKNPARYAGIYDDNVSSGEIVLGADVPGKFILHCLVDPYFNEKLTMRVVAPVDSDRTIMMAPSGPLTIELLLKSPGDMHCYLSQTYIPKELGRNDDTRKLGIVVNRVDFEYNPEAVPASSVQVFPTQN